jgi:hypothetical protein
MYDVQTEFVLVFVNSSLLTRPLPPEAIPLVRPNSCDEKYLGTDGRADRGKTVYPPLFY